MADTESNKSNAKRIKPDQIELNFAKELVNQAADEMISSYFSINPYHPPYVPTMT